LGRGAGPPWDHRTEAGPSWRSCVEPTQHQLRQSWGPAALTATPCLFWWGRRGRWMCRTAGPQDSGRRCLSRSTVSICLVPTGQIVVWDKPRKTNQKTGTLVSGSTQVSANRPSPAGPVHQRWVGLRRLAGRCPRLLVPVHGDQQDLVTVVSGEALGLLYGTLVTSGQVSGNVDGGSGWRRPFASACTARRHAWPGEKGRPPRRPRARRQCRLTEESRRELLQASSTPRRVERFCSAYVQTGAGARTAPGAFSTGDHPGAVDARQQ